MTKSNRGLAVMIMAMILSATIFMIPVPAASASTAGNAAVVKPNAAGRYILSGTVVQEPVIECEDLDGNNIQLLYCMIEDCNGEVWGYAYEMDNLNDVPSMYQSVTLIMNCNGTPDDNFDDIIEDILWCNCENAAEED
jgi:hypothetical protein